MKREKVLITGGTGFIGSNLIFRLFSRYSCHLLIREESNLWRLKTVSNKIKIYKIDYFNTQKLEALVKKINPDYIIHLGSYGGSSDQENLETIVKTNIQFTVNLLTATKNLNYKAFLNTGSSSEYGFKKKPMKETDFLEPNSFYSATKASATYISKVFAEHFNKPIVTIRPFSVYGPFESPNRFIPTIIKNLILKKEIKLTPGKIRRDFIYVDDLIDGYVALMKKAKKFKGKVFNLGTGKEYTNMEIVQELFKVTNSKVPVKKGSFKKRNWDTEHWSADLNLVKSELGWQPRVSVREGLLKTYEWFLKNPKILALYNEK
jgi:nucleoside-diphosphate-sugar epimerase